MGKWHFVGVGGVRDICSLFSFFFFPQKLPNSLELAFFIDIVKMSKGGPKQRKEGRVMMILMLERQSSYSHSC